MSVIRSAFIAVFSFAAGVTTMDTAQEWRDTKKAEQTAEQVRKCMGYLVVTSDGKTTECRSLMPRFDADWMLKPSPLKLKKRELRKAIAGDLSTLRSEH